MQGFYADEQKGHRELYTKPIGGVRAEFFNKAT